MPSFMPSLRLKSNLFALLCLLVPTLGQAVSITTVTTNGQSHRKVTLTQPVNTCAATQPTNLRQGLLTSALTIWQDFGYQIYDVSSRIPPFPTATFNLLPNQPHQTAKTTPRLLRLGLWEDNQKTDAHIARFWASIPDGKTFINRQNAVWQAANTAGWADPWSAAFISHLMCQNGISMADFKRNQSHWQYMDDIIKGNSSLYKAEDIITSGLPQVGDIICADRAKPAYTSLKDRQQNLGTPRPLHCDMVIKRDWANNRLFAIGGNVANGVAVTAIRITKTTKNGKDYFHPEITPYRPWFTTLKYQRTKEKTNFKKALNFN